MQSDIITIILGFIEGFILILSPCILPILPIVLASSLTGSRRRPLGIIIGFTLSFALFALFSRSLVRHLGIDLNLIRYISYGLLIGVGVIMCSTYLTNKFSLLTTKLHISAPAITTKQGFLSGLFIGSLIALVWTPCAGPILAAVVVQTVLQKTNYLSVLTLLAFGLGAAIPMYIIALYGRKLTNALSFFKKHASLLRRMLGLTIIASIVTILYMELNPYNLIKPKGYINTATTLEDGLWHSYTAPPINGIETWFNSKPLDISQLQGKVVLVDFWTYSCINCIRTIPYLNQWYQKYANQGLVIIGVHTPEFDFEKLPSNVYKAIKGYAIQYPVASDNQYATWLNYKNHYWPAHYLINKDGKIVYEHFGEGDYDVMENNIRYLLGIDKPTLGSSAAESFVLTETPETYLGSARADSFLGPALTPNQITEYFYPTMLGKNAWGLHGRWEVFSDKIKSVEPNNSIKIHFNAAKVYAVMGNSTAQPIHVGIYLNNKKVNQLVVDKYSLYQLLDLHQLTNGYLELVAESPGLELYTFTFGE